MLPTWALKGIIVGALLAATVIGYRAWEDRVYQRGKTDAENVAKAREVAITAEANKNLADATADSLQRERQLRADLTTMDALRLQERTTHEKAIGNLLARARAGDERLRVAVNARSLCPSAAGADRPATAGPGEETRADLMPGTTERIFSIASGITSLVRDYNALVDRYNRARETCNAVAP